METYLKDRNGLSKIEIDPKDKMNFNAVVNILHRLKRIQLQSDIVNVCSKDSQYLIKLPRNQPKRDKFVLRTKDAAIKDATNLGMETTDDLRCKLPPVPISSKDNYCEECPKLHYG
ncbi:hypothetical protein FQA39_LY05460 [Lamprigera yunnana]|nr:hypothetical protein FQA39_LY05460 [Lamprigera yunnana]